MKRQTFTILIVSKGGRAPLGFTLSLQTAYIAASMLVLILAGIAGMYRSNHQLSVIAAKMPVVTAENARLQADLAQLESELGTMVSKMAALEMLGREVRGLVSEVVPEEMAFGMGGSYPEKPESIEEALYYLRAQIPLQEDELENLLEEVAAYKEELDATPDFRPANGRVTSAFGWRASPFNRRTTFHSGIDIGAPYGAPVWAAASGRVVQARYQTGYGNYIIIDHGTYTTHYAHLRKFLVSAGDVVEKGQRIGEVGSTGYSTGPHLHFEIHRNGEPLNPLEMIN
jgi:murein DD-endopeptidase MepM/ murein hydrolase activator NlpD